VLGEVLSQATGVLGLGSGLPGLDPGSEPVDHQAHHEGTGKDSHTKVTITAQKAASSTASV